MLRNFHAAQVDGDVRLMKRPSADTSGAILGIGGAAVIALCCAVPVLLPVGAVVGVAAFGANAFSRRKSAHPPVQPPSEVSKGLPPD